MAIAFTYTESTNLVVQTGGTSGTPATFASFVTADRAGTADLLPAENCTVNHTLTYQIRPVEDLALQISFILSGTSAGATDTLDVTGTDWDGQAQNESIDVSGGDATYNGAYKWRTITDIDCTGWADGTLQVTQPRWGVIWDYGNSQYKIDANFYIGDHDTSTYFQSVDEEMVFFGDVDIRTKFNADLRLGEKYGDWGTRGVFWSVGRTADFIQLGDNGIVNIYASKLHVREERQIIWNEGELTVLNSILSAQYYTSSTSYRRSMYIWPSMSYLELNNVFIVNMFGFPLYITPDIYSNVHHHRSETGPSAFRTVITRGVASTSVTNDTYTNQTGKLYNIDPITPVISPFNNVAAGEIYEQYTCNIHFADKDGANLAGVTALCQDKDGNEVFSVVADANGDIAEQTITYKRWVTTAETLTEYTPHKFTISKAGYETLVMDNITVDAPIVWKLELQTPKYTRSMASRPLGIVGVAR